MKKNLKMMVKKVAEIACIVGLTLAVNGVVDSVNDTKVQPVVNAQEVSKVEKESTLKDNNPLEKKVTEPTKKGMMIKAENWLDDSNDENKDLTGNVIIEDGNKTIEISKEVYDEIEYGENSDLEGDIYLDDEDIINVVDNELVHQVNSVEELKSNFSKFGVVDSKDDGNRYTVTLDNGLEIIYLIDYDMFYVYNNDGNIKEFECMNDTKDYLSTIKNDSKNEDNKEYTQEDYSKYLEYKQSLIDEYGQEMYELMNQEAGITNEEESFKHYMEYGI